MSNQVKANKKNKYARKKSNEKNDRDINTRSFFDVKKF